jgi:hypothetical protein
MKWEKRATTADEVNLAAIAKKYGVSAKDIVKANGVPWNSAAIDAWVLSVHGAKYPSGQTHFRPGNKIFLPALPKPPTASQVAAPAGMSVVTWAAIGGGAALLWAWSRKKRKK